MLRVTEIFASIQGETSYAGLPFAFVRLTGCNLRCRYCDTTYAYDGGDDFDLEEIIARVKLFGIPRAMVTGGEPLLQSGTPALVSAFLDLGWTVLVETNGTVPVAPLDPRAVKIIDVKCPGSEDEYRCAKGVIAKYRNGRDFKVLLSPAFGLLAPGRLAGWMVGDALDARFQL